MKYKFRLLEGLHVENGPIGANGLPTDVIYKRGDIFESESDLLQFNRGPNSQKFERIHDDRPVTSEVQKQAVPRPEGKQSQQLNLPAELPLEQMTEKELVAFAAEEEIDLKGVKGKDNILRVLRGKH